MADFLIMDDNRKDDNIVNNKSNIKKDSLFHKINSLVLSFQRVKVKEKAIFYRLMSTMTNSGMGVVKSVTILEKQEKNIVFKKILGTFVKELSEGKSLSECLEMFPSSFSEAEIGMIKSGEKTGKLNTALRDLAVQIEKISSISGKLKSAMIYPAFIVLVVLGVVFILMTMVVPKLLEIFGDKSQLPASTKTLIAISDFFRSYWYIMIIFAVLFFFFVLIWKKTPDGRYNFDSIMLKIPIFGDINKKIILSKFARVLSGLVSSGVSIVESLKITSDAVGNEVYKQRIILLSEDVSGGIKIFESLDGDKLFPDMMVQMIQVGEETAKLDQTVSKVADFYDEQVDNVVAAINKLLEPIIIITLALIVGLIAVGVMEPIMNIANIVSEQ